MPKFDSMQTVTVPGGGGFQFSAVRPDTLGATEYTLVTLVVDVTSSVQPFSAELLRAVKSVVAACRRNPRADNLMLRLMLFNKDRHEVHGFVPLSQVDPEAYPPLRCNGITGLYDAVYDAVAATNTYARDLFTQDLDVNAAVYIITDGLDNCSTVTPAAIAEQVRKAMRQEYLESLITVLVGVGTHEAGVSAHLQLFKDDAQLSQFVDVADASADNLAKLGHFVSRSISMQSQALGTGGPSQNLAF